MALISFWPRANKSGSGFGHQEDPNASLLLQEVYDVTLDYRVRRRRDPECESGPNATDAILGRSLSPMPQNKKHHYVPRFYLKRFSTDGKTINLLNLKNKKKVLSASLKKQCYRSYFYGHGQEVEAILGDLEGIAAIVLQLIDREQQPPTPGSEAYLLLVIYVLMQHGRTAHSADTLNEINDRLLKQILRPRAQAKGIDVTRVAIGLDEVGRYSTGMAMQYYPLLLDLEARLVRNDTCVELVTSDNPVVLYNQLLEFRKWGNNTGLMAKGLQIFFPIGPSTLLFLFDSGVYSVPGRHKRVVSMVRARDIHELNALQVCSAAENIYFRDADADVDRLYRRSLPHRRAQRSRVEVFRGKQTEARSRELVTASVEEIRTNLRLSFVGVRKSAKSWREEFRRRKTQPAVVVRDERMVEDHREFSRRVDRGEYKHWEFARFLENKYIVR